jgi:hypothetical protein
MTGGTALPRLSSKLLKGKQRKWKEKNEGESQKKGN